MALAQFTPPAGRYGVLGLTSLELTLQSGGAAAQRWCHWAWPHSRGWAKVVQTLPPLMGLVLRKLLAHPHPTAAQGSLGLTPSWAPQWPPAVGAAALSVMGRGWVGLLPLAACSSVLENIHPPQPGQPSTTQPPPSCSAEDCCLATLPPRLFLDLVRAAAVSLGSGDTVASRMLAK